MLINFSSVQLLSYIRLFVTPGTAALQASLSITSSWSLLKLMYQVGDTIQPSHPLLSPSPPAFNLSQHQGLFQWVSSLHQVAKVLELQLQSFQRIFSWFALGWTGWISLQPKGLSRVFSNTTVQNHQFFSTQLSLWSNFYMHTWLPWKTIALTRRTFVGKVMSLLFNMLSRLSIAFFPQGASVFKFHGCGHHLQWFWSPRK